MLNTGRRSLWALIAGLCWVSCAPEKASGTATEVIVEIDAEDLVKAEAASLRVEVEGADGVDALAGRVTRLQESIKPVTFPKRVAIVPIDPRNDKRVFVLTATVFDSNGDFVAQARIISGYVPRQVRYAKLLIEGSKCLRLACDGDRETCTNGVCVDGKVDVTTLSTASAEPTAVKFLEGDAAVMESDTGPTEADSGAAETDAEQAQVDLDSGGPVLNECAGGAVAACGEGATACSHTGGVDRCTCAVGYSGTGTAACIEVDECATGVATACGAGATGCSNTNGGYVCSCGGGVYALNADRQGCHLRSWGTAKLIETDNAGDVLSVALDMDGAGNAMVVFWSQSDGTRNSIWASRSTLGSSWGTPAPIQVDVRTAWGPKLAMDSSGNAVAVWDHSGSVWTSRYAAGSWGTPGPVDPQHVGSVSYPFVAAGESGNAVALWRQPNELNVPFIWSSRYTTAAGWGMPTLVGGGDFYAAAMNWTDVVVASTMPSSAYSNLSASLYRSSSWDVATSLVSERTEWASRPAVAIDSQGNVMLVWQQSSSNARSNIWASRYASGRSWDTPTLLETDNVGSASWPAVVMDGSGNAVAAWTQSDGTYENLWASRYIKGNGWSTTTLIEGNVGNAAGPALATDGLGNVVAVWSQSDGTRTNIWANRYAAGGTWSTPTLIESDNAGHASGPLVAMDDVGNAMAVWIQSDGTRKNLWANRFE